MGAKSLIRMFRRRCASLQLFSLHLLGQFANHALKLGDEHVSLLYLPLESASLKLELVLGDLNGLKQIIVRILLLVQIPAHFVQIKCQLLALALLCPQFRLELTNQSLINVLFLLILIF